MPPVTTYAFLAYEAENMTNETIQRPMTYFARILIILVNNDNTLVPFLKLSHYHYTTYIL